MTSLTSYLSPTSAHQARLYKLKRRTAVDSLFAKADGIVADAGHFNTAYLPHLTNNIRVQIYYGGSGSGKSVFIAQRVVIDLMRGNRNYLICRAVGRDSRRSTFNEVRKVITAWDLWEYFTENKSDLTITCSNGYQAIFTGLDDTEKLKSITPVKGVITDVWVEEATQTTADSVKQLLKRQRGGDPTIPKRLTLSFNPIVRTHWIYQEYFKPIGWRDNQTEYNGDDLTILKTWYIHNEFLTDADVADLENETDSYYYEVYTLGNWGVLGDVIFKNWRVEDLSGMLDQFTNRRYGLDFGFSSDPAAVVCSHYDKKRKRIYVYDELYAYELTNDVLANEVKALIGDQRIICDSAEPKSIAELQMHGVNAVGAKKGPDSVMHGIQWLQQHEIIVDSKCINTQQELSLMQWKKDRHGESLRQPQDKHNHLNDGLRYAHEEDMGKKYKKPGSVRYA